MNDSEKKRIGYWRWAASLLVVYVGGYYALADYGRSPGGPGGSMLVSHTESQFDWLGLPFYNEVFAEPDEFCLCVWCVPSDTEIECPGVAVSENSVSPE